jgi:hypothetical protein
VIDLPKNGLGYILGDFSQTHPVTLVSRHWHIIKIVTMGKKGPPWLSITDQNLGSASTKPGAPRSLV